MNSWGRIAAFGVSLALYAGNASASPYQWLPQGPETGLLEKIVVHPTNPDVAYGLTGSGALYKTMDSGDHWAFLNAGGLNVQVVSLQIDPEDTETLYAAAVGGIFRSIDGGRSWKRLGADVPEDLISIVVTSTPPATLLSSDALGQVWKSVDRGDSWQVTSAAFPGPTRFAPDPRVGSRVFAYSANVVFATVNEGQTWDLAAFGWFDNIVVSPHQSTFLLGSISGVGLLRSRLGGPDFQVLSGFPSLYVKTIAFDPSRAGRILVSSSDGLFETLDEGDTWEPVALGFPQDPWVASVAFDSTGSRLYAGSSELAPRSHGFIRSNDGGATWTRALVERLFGDLTFTIRTHPENPGTAWASALERFYRTTDRGATWESLSMLPLLRDLDIDPNDPLRMLAVALEQGNLLRTQDGGLTWVPTTGLPPTGAHNVYDVARSPADPSTVLAAVDFDVYLSSNGGASWSPTTPINATEYNSIASVAFSFCRDTTAILAGGNRYMYRSEDGGATWQLVTGLPEFASIAKIVVPNETRVCSVFAVRYQDLYRSIDGGRSFSKVSVPKDGAESLWELVFNPTVPREGFLIGAEHLYRTADGGRSWSTAQSSALGSSLGAWGGAISPDGRTLYAATGNGIYRFDRAFDDVPPEDPAEQEIDAVALHGVTAGCGGGDFCPSDSVTRAQSSVFLLRSLEGSEYEPPPPTGTLFADVPADAFAAAWIEEIADRGITAGCGGGFFCPNAEVTRAQAAVLNLRTKNGSGYQPPPATGTMFDDVPASHYAAAWIEEFARQGYTAGCAPSLFCPEQSVSRGQMAVFLAGVFALF